MFSYFGLIKILSSSKQRRFATRYTSYQLIFPLRGKLKATCLPEQNIRHKTKHFKRCNWGLKMNEKPNTEWILTTLQNTRNNYVHYYPKNVKLLLAVDHITHNKEMKCKLNTSQCVLTIIIVGPRMRKVGGGGGGCRWRGTQSTSPGSHSSKLFRFDCFLVRLKQLERVHLE